MQQSRRARRSTRDGIVLTLLLALAAPWGALCLAAGPAGVMVCCQKPPQSVRVEPCCPMHDGRGGTPTIPDARPAAMPLQPVAGVTAPLPLQPRRVSALPSPVVLPIDIRLLASIFLI